jgi:hypothetical protein
MLLLENVMKLCGFSALGFLLLALPCCAQVGPVRLQITPANTAIVVGANQQLAATISFLGNRTGGTDITNGVRWQSSDTTIAAVSNTGLVTADPSNRGTVTITAIRGPFRASTTLTVIPNATLLSLAVAPKTASIPKGLRQQFAATGTFTGSITQDVTASATWGSSDITVAVIVAPGLAKGLKPNNSTTITASFQGKNDTATLQVTPPILQSIVVAPLNPAIPLGLTQQFSATGILSDGSTEDLTNLATWASTNTPVATINNTGLASSVAQGSATITATYLGIMGSTLLTVNPPLLLSIAVTPVDPTIPQGATLQLTATGAYTDHSTKNITNLVAWTSSNPAVVAVNNTGLLAGNAIGFGTITATQGTIAASTTALIGFSALSLNGRYAFSFTGVDGNGEFFVAGSLQADGNGSLSGVEDFNGGAGVTPNLAFSGNYTVGIDGRGSATLNTGDTLKFVLTASGNAVISQFNTFALAWGAAAPQDSNAFVNLRGNFAFQLSGLGAAGPQGSPGHLLADVGQFSADGSGHISSGQEDVNDSGAVTTFTFSGSYTAADSNGRGTLTLNNNDHTTSRFVYYIVGADQVNLVSLDLIPAFLGVAHLRSSQTFSNSSLSGFYVFSESGPASTDQFKTNANTSLFNAAGVFFADGGGNLSGRQDSNDSGGVNENASTSGTYGVASSGRGTATIDGFPYVFYVVTPSLAYFMNTDSGAVLTRTLQSQLAITFTTSSFQGNFNLLLNGEDLVNTSFLAMSAQMFADGSGTLSGTEDVNNGGTLSANIALNGTYSVEADGRGSGSINGPNGTLTLHFYMISFDQAVFVETDANNDQIGSARVQF